MKRRLVIFGLFMVLVAAFIALSRDAGRRPTGQAPSIIVVTQEGGMTVALQPDQYTTGMFVASMPRPSTNAPPSRTNTSGK